jgi:hypothetical protein
VVNLPSNELPQFRSRDEVRAYINELLSTRSELMQARIKTWTDAGRLTLLLLLMAAYLQFYYLDILIEMLTWPATFMFTAPAKTGLLLLSSLA